MPIPAGIHQYRVEYPSIVVAETYSEKTVHEAERAGRIARRPSGMAKET
jgi:hypothetical protein